jgi:hypothetical protein
MANNQIQFNETTSHGRFLRSYLTQLAAAYNGLSDLLDTTLDMIEAGDATQEANFTTVVTRFGFESTAKAKAGYDELRALMDKLSSNSSQTNVKQSIQQALRHFR